MKRYMIATRSAAGLSMLAALLITIISGCGGSGPVTTASPSLSHVPSSTPSASARATPAPSAALTTSAPAIRNIWDFQPLGPIRSGTYFIDPDLDPSTPLRVVYDVLDDGWSMWVGAAKFNGDGGHVGVSITTVNNLVTDGCSDHSWANPPVGPSVDDLTAALAALAPFEVTSQPTDVTIYGYSGTHLAWTVPGMPTEGGGPVFTGCAGRQLKSWVAPFDTEPGDAFYGYTGPGYSEEFWILDVEGTRLMIAAGQSDDAPSEDIAELRAILDSIRIEL